MPHRNDHRRPAEPARHFRQEAHGASNHPSGPGWNAAQDRLQPDDYYDGRQRGGVSEGSFARGGYGQGYPREYGGYGYEPRRSPQARGEFAYPEVQAVPYARDGGRPHPGHPDADYHQWRAEHLQALDDDYRSYREQQRRQFPDGFSAWRESRRNPPREAARSSGGSGGTQSSAPGQTASGDPSGSAASLGPIGNGTAPERDGK